MTDGELLAAGTLRLVGSTLSKRKPRDIDLVLTIPTRVFVRLFGSVAKWKREGETGQWTAARFAWSDRCVRLSHDGGPQDHSGKPAGLWEKTMKPRFTFTLYKARDGWRWNLKTRNSRIVAESGEAYTTKRKARNGIGLTAMAGAELLVGKGVKAAVIEER